MYRLKDVVPILKTQVSKVKTIMWKWQWALARNWHTLQYKNPVKRCSQRDYHQLYFLYNFSSVTSHWNVEKWSAPNHNNEVFHFFFSKLSDVCTFFVVVVLTSLLQFSSIVFVWGWLNVEQTTGIKKTSLLSLLLRCLKYLF